MLKNQDRVNITFLENSNPSTPPLPLSDHWIRYCKNQSRKKLESTCSFMQFISNINIFQYLFSMDSLLTSKGAKPVYVKREKTIKL